MEIEFTLLQINDAAKLFWKSAGAARVFAFHGAMGAGKTTFIHALCKVQGVSGITGSPTFSIINEYETGSGSGTIFHMDLYRLKDEQEAINAGVEDSLHSGNLCLVEWPERAPGIFPEETLHVYIDITDSEHRRLRIDGN